MAKWSNDLGLDAALDWFTDVDKMVICSQQPTTYAEANATYALADVAVDAGDFTKANGDVSGRKVTVAAQSGVTVDAKYFIIIALVAHNVSFFLFGVIVILRFIRRHDALWIE